MAKVRKPQAQNGDLRHLPPALTPLIKLPHWVLWRFEKPKGKWTKVPYQPNGKLAKNNDPATWSSYDEVIAHVAKFDGIGFCLLNTEISAFDIDKCRTSAIHPWASEFVNKVNSYTEVTVSGTGLRIIGYGNGEEVHRKQQVIDGVSLETYRKATRYIVITGNPLPNTAQQLVNIDKAMDDVVAELDANKKQEKKPGDKHKLPANLRRMLYFEDHGANVPTGGYPGRSELFWAFVNEAVREGIHADVIVEAVLDPAFAGYAIYAHVMDNKGEDYVRRQLEKAFKELTDAPIFSEEALALEFAEKHSDKLRYVDAWGKWFIWDGTCWRRDEKRKVFSLARDLCRAIATTSNKPSERKRIASAKTRAAVVSLASDDQRLAAITAQWDADPWLLNTPGGVVDLCTGKLRPHKVEDYMTKITAFTPGGDCPKWKQFIKQVTAGDGQFAKFLQCSSGYALTGLIADHALFFLHGKGQNGKTQYLLTLAGVMGDYHRAAPIEVFLESNTDRHPTELAWLMGVRLVTASEPPAGRRWNFNR